MVVVGSRAGGDGADDAAAGGSEPRGHLTTLHGWRIVVHDYAGHAFPLDLSRWLAGQGATVLHLYSADVEAPRGRLERQPADPPGFMVEALSLGRSLPKYALWRRWSQERAHGRLLGRRVAAFAPHVVLSANTPPAVQAGLAAAARACGARLVCWVQDVFTAGLDARLSGWPAAVRALARALVGRVEFGVMRRADALVVIADDFLPLLAAHGVRHPVSAVIENWCPRDEVSPRPQDNPWSRRHGLAGRFVFLYAGTLGLKHHPGRLADLAAAFADDPAVRVVVVSQGPGRAVLEAEKARRRLDGLVLLDVQPYAVLPEVLGSAAVTVALLQPFAGVLSVPSKVYSYFAAERPVLAAVPAANLAARLIAAHGAGLCVAPDDGAGFLAAARRLHQDAALRAAAAAGQRAYADQAFAMERIGPRFVAVLAAAGAGTRRPGG